MMLGVFTELLEPGGVQRLGRHQAAALVSFAALRGGQCPILSLNDPKGLHEFSVADHQVAIEGFGRDRKALARRALSLVPRVDRVFFNHPYLGPIGLLMRLRRPSLRYRVMVHGIEVWEPLGFVRQLAMRFATSVVVTAPFNGEMVHRHQPWAGRPMIEVIHPAIDPGMDAASPEEDDPGSVVPAGPFILTVARINKGDAGKRIDTLLKSFAVVAKDHSDWLLLHVGDGNDRPRLEGIARETGLGDRIRFLGRQPDAVLRRLYARCGVFAMPSAKEGFGIVFLEAMARAKPVIGGNAGGTPEIVIEGETGFLVNPESVEEIADRLGRLMADAGVRQRLGAAGRRRLEAEFVYERFIRRSHEVLSSW